MNKPGPLLPPDVIEAMNRGQLIEAIKLLRQSSPMGLKQAKDLVDAHLRKRSAPGVDSLAAKPAAEKGFDAVKAVQAATGLSPGEVPRSDGYVSWIVVAALLAAGAYFF